MVTTGLLSLNVHEALTFEGTELCLHPDLFSGTTDAPSYHGSAAVGGGSRLSTTTTNSSSKLPLVTTAATLSSEMLTPVASTLSESKTLQVGDMVEIRVWDPLPKGGASSQQHHQHSSGASASNASTIVRSRPTSATVSAASSTTSAPPDPRPLGTLHDTSLQYSDASVSVGEIADGGDETLKRKENIDASPSASSTVSSAGDNTNNQSQSGSQAQQQQSSPSEPLVTSPSSTTVEGDDSIGTPKDVFTGGSTAELPPVVPRGRTNTADNVTMTRNSLLAAAPAPAPAVTKPPLQRRSTGASVPVSQPRASATGVTSILSKPRHHRDLSDMTADTVYGGNNTPLEASQQLVDFHLPLTTAVTTGDVVDVDDDMWTTMSSSHSLRMSFVMLVTEKTLTSLKGSARTQVSILRQVADLYQLSSYDMVSIHKVAKEEEEAALEAVSADFVTVTIKDQFISRGDMHFFQGSMIGSWVYEGQRLYEPTRGFQANAREIRHREKQALSGIITDNTTITCRSRSSRIIWLVQISSEMWDYASPYERGQDESLCEIYFDKWITFVHKLFGKWKQLEVSHSLTVVFFSRSFSSGQVGSEENAQHDVYGRRYHDHYRVILENEIGPDWDSLILRIKEAFVNYPAEVGWTLSSGDNEYRPSTASQGNVLEAINVTLNLLQFHYLDRDLQRTGNSIVIVSAGNGVFEVDKGLAGISYQRMMDNGIGSDVLSLGLPALHIAPFFLYNNVYQSAEIEDVDSQEQYYEVPHWMHLSFVSYESDESVFIDHLFEAEEHKEDRKLQGNFAGLEIAANGFLLPRSSEASNNEEVSVSSPLLGSMSFSARGNAAASPLRRKPPKPEMSRERQLIAGRDFRDILDACRPRNAGAIPSALVAILEMQVTPKGGVLTDDDCDSTGHTSTGSRTGLQEWGALEFDDLIKSGSPVRKEVRSSSMGHEYDRLSPSLLGRSPPRGAYAHHGGCSPDDSSHASSIASQISSSVLGLSYDRPYLAHKGSPSFGEVQLQRSPSLEIEILANDVSEETAGNDHMTKENGTDLEETLRAMMRAHDAKVTAEPSPKLMGVPEPIRKDDQSVGRQGSQRATSSKPGTQSGPLLQRRQSLSKGIPAPGGLGAALSQYRSQSTSSKFSSEIEPTNNAFHRIGSTGRLHVGSRVSSAHNSAADLGSRGLSPLLLPPVVSTTSGFFEATGPPDFPTERRYLQPQALSRPTGNDSVTGRTFGRSPGLILNARVADMRSEARRQDGQQENSRSFSTSPPTSRMFGISPPTKEKLWQHRARRDQHASMKQRSTQRGPPKSRSSISSRKAKVLNPFRQQDEVEVLAKKSHNRRRWSHVFPLGEVEFKRHSGPNWKSLTAPAALPVVIDYFPTQAEIDRNFTVSMYNVTLNEFDHTNYSSNTDLLVEMVRQRLIQDFQLVSEDYIRANDYRRETNDGLVQRGRVVPNSDNSGMIRYFLSMGHRLQVLTYDPTAADVIEVTRYNAKHAQKNSSFKYEYLSYCQETQSYYRVHQTFEKYGEEYNWNKVDRLLCGGDDKEMREGMRFKRIQFGIIPECFDGDKAAESAYVAKFRRLLEYFEKLRSKEDAKTPLDITFVTSTDRKEDETVERIESTPGLARNSMQRFYVQLRKGKRENFEWVEIAIDSTFDTSWSYRIMFSWLVASSGKVETQVQLLQRRCTQYGLNLVPFPQVTVSRSVYLNPFKAPAILTIRNKEHARRLDRALTRIDFLHDGVFHTDIKTILDCMEDSHDFHFERRWGMPVPGRNFVHRSGTLFVRVLTDRNGLCVLIVLGNYRYMSVTKDASLVASYKKAFKALTECLSSLGREEPESANDQPKGSTLDNNVKLETATKQHNEDGGPDDPVGKPSESNVTEPPLLNKEPDRTLSPGSMERTESVEIHDGMDASISAERPSPAGVIASTTKQGAAIPMLEQGQGASTSRSEGEPTNHQEETQNETREELVGELLVETEEAQQQHPM